MINRNPFCFLVVRQNLQLDVMRLWYALFRKEGVT